MYYNCCFSRIHRNTFSMRRNNPITIFNKVISNSSFSCSDRKKDLVKLAHGEYISLGKVESTLKHSKYVENCCAYGDSKESFIVLLVVPVQAALQELADELGVSANFDDQCSNKEIVKRVLADIQTVGKKCKSIE